MSHTAVLLMQPQVYQCHGLSGCIWCWRWLKGFGLCCGEGLERGAGAVLCSAVLGREGSAHVRMRGESV